MVTSTVVPSIAEMSTEKRTVPLREARWRRRTRERFTAARRRRSRRALSTTVSSRKAASNWASDCLIRNRACSLYEVAEPGSTVAAARQARPRAVPSGADGRFCVLIHADESQVVAADLIGGGFALERAGDELLEGIAPDAAPDGEAHESVDGRRLGEPVIDLVVIGPRPRTTQTTPSRPPARVW